MHTWRLLLLMLLLGLRAMLLLLLLMLGLVAHVLLLLRWRDGWLVDDASGTGKEECQWCRRDERIRIGGMTHPRYQNMRFEIRTCSYSGLRGLASLMCESR